jgi:SAM-dependent methyltransferase
MDRAYETKYHVQEDKHWWFKTRRDIIIKLLQKSDRNSKILEIGCSGGPLILALNERGYQDVHGIDISRDAIDLCKRRNIRNVFLMDGSKPAFDDGQFDLVIASDVLEHIEDEATALSEWNRILKPAGKLIVFVPAFENLWSKHDEANHHFRRYSKSELTRVLKKADFEITRSSYWNFLLFSPTSLVRLIQRICSNRWQNRRGDQLLEVNSILNEFLFNLIKAENVILRLVNFPVGVSIFATAAKNVTDPKSVYDRSFSQPSVS